MPSIRIGLSTDFNLTNELVGINTTVPSVRLDVRGQILSQNTAGGSGISTLTTYDGFLDAQQRVTSNITISQTTKGNLNSLSGEIILDEEVTVTDGTPLTGGRLDSLTVTGAFDLPHGGTASRETTPEKGSTRFNQDLGQLEFYTGTEWRTTLSYDGSGRGRGVFGGGSPLTSNIQYINIQSTGNAVNFGNLTSARAVLSSCSSNIRGVFGGGVTPTYLNTIDYITIASEGNSITFGTLSTANRGYLSACSSSTRGVFGGGYTTSPANATINVIDYIQFSTLGNALDFGDLFTGRYLSGSFSSPTRGMWGGGTGIGPTYLTQKSIEFITISSTGNATNFGDLTQSKAQNPGCSNSVLGFFMGGSLLAGSSFINTIDYITIASVGNAITFGDLTQSRGRGGCCSTSTRGVLGGGITPSVQNTIDYVIIASAGNAIDFGDLSLGTGGNATCSDSHGGLGGF